MTIDRLVCGWCSYHEFFVKIEGIAQLFADGSKISEFAGSMHTSFVCACCGAESTREDLVIEDELPTHYQVKGGNS